MKFNSTPLVNYLNTNKISVNQFCEIYHINKTVIKKLFKQTLKMNGIALSTIVKISLATEIDLIDFLEK